MPFEYRRPDLSLDWLEEELGSRRSTDLQAPELETACSPPEASAKDLKQQVELLRRDYKEIAGVLRGGVNAIWKKQQQARERQRGPERDFGPSR